MADETPQTIAPANSMGVPSGAHLTLRNSPTGGAPGEHSPYYRRLLSAGYKGYLQGIIGGSTLYGIMGAAIGAVIAAPIFFFGLIPGVTAAAWLLVPALAGIGLFKGASTFGNIGSVAAISAESAEMLEERRYLLERYYSLPDSPEYKQEAEEIARLIAKQHETKPPGNIFHWKTVLVSAALGAGIAVGLSYFLPFMLAHIGIGEFLLAPLAEGGLGLALGAHMTWVSGAITAAIGALAGTMIGLDRYYVRRWLDFSENLLTDPEHIKQAVQEKEQDTQRLLKASPTKGSESTTSRGRSSGSSTRRDLPEPRQPIARSDAPSTVINGAQLESRLADIHAAMSRPAV